jgi:hypothetical protein
MSLRKRIQILLAFLVGIPLLLLLYESYRTGLHSLTEQMKNGSLQIARLESAEIDLFFDPPRLIVEGIVRALETDSELVAGRIRNLLYTTVIQTPEIFGVSVALDPDMTTLGRFAAYSYRRHGEEEVRSPDYSSADYIGRPWYQLAIVNNRGMWSDPYLYESGHVLMVTFSAPIRREGRVVGVAEVDLDIDDVVARLRQIRPGGGGAVYLVNKQGRILAHPNMSAISDVNEKRDLGGLMDLLRRHGEDTVEIIDPISKTRSWVVETPIRSLAATRGGADWSLIVNWPIATHLAHLTEFGRRILVLYLFLGGASLLLLNRSFDHFITRPLSRLAEQARRYAEGDFSQLAVMGLEDTLELRGLGQALNSLGAALAESSCGGRKDGQQL